MWLSMHKTDYHRKLPFAGEKMLICQTWGVSFALFNLVVRTGIYRKHNNIKSKSDVLKKKRIGTML